MRTILFRAKRFDTNEFVEGYYFETPLTDGSTDSTPDSSWSFLTGKKCHVISRNSCVYQVIPETLGQFTGLTDKNGTNIFEGDILKMQNVGWKYTLVKFHSGGFCFYITETNYLHPIIPCYSKEGEVVGNIHNNPELIQ